MTDWYVVKTTEGKLSLEEMSTDSVDMKRVLKSKEEGTPMRFESRSDGEEFLNNTFDRELIDAEFLTFDTNGFYI